MVIEWHRCPANFKSSDLPEKVRDKFIGKPMDGCWFTLGLLGIKQQRGGSLRCAHCGAHLQRFKQEELVEVPKEVPGIKVYLKKLKITEDTKFDPKLYHIACCFNKNCSRIYLKDNAGESDARGEGGMGMHSGTQYVWFNVGEQPDSWDFGEDKTREGKPEEPRVDERGRSWRRCVFCGDLLKITDRSEAGRIYRRQGDDDQSWQWYGPAASFRILRSSEYEKMTGNVASLETMKV